MFVLAVVVCGFAALAPQATASPRTQIVGGQTASADTFPWMAAIIDQIDPETVGFCSGTVVSPHIVLTAGHCVVDDETGGIMSPAGYTVVTGNVNWTASPRQVLGVSQILIYPNYIIGGSLDGWGDAALLVLSAPTSAPAISLATSANAERLQPGTPAVIAGWGDTFYGQAKQQRELEWAETVVQSGGYCEGNAPGFHPLGQICTVNPPSFGTGTCHGDSGGPLIAEGPGGSGVIELGVTSSGDPECATSQPHVFTRADLIASWVKGRIAIFDPPPRPAPAPAPPPALTLPVLTRRKAAYYARLALKEHFGARLRRGRQYGADCQRIDDTKRRCGVHWNYRANDYYGSVTIYYAFSGSEVVWDDRFTIHWVNDYCHFYSGHRRSCRIHMAHG